MKIIIVLFALLAVPLYAESLDSKQTKELFDIPSFKLNHLVFARKNFIDILQTYAQVDVKVISLDKSESGNPNSKFINEDFEFYDSTFRHSDYLKKLSDNVYYHSGYVMEYSGSSVSLFATNYQDKVLDGFKSPEVVKLIKSLQSTLDGDFAALSMKFYDQHNRIIRSLYPGSIKYYTYRGDMLVSSKFTLFEWGIDFVKMDFDYQENGNFREIKKVHLEFKKDESDSWKPWQDWYFTYKYKDPQAPPQSYTVTATSGLSVRDRPSLDARKTGSMPYKLRIAVYEESQNMETIDGITAPWMRIKAVENGEYMEGWSWGGLFGKNYI